MRTLSAILLCLTASSAPAHAGWRLFGGNKAAVKAPVATPAAKPAAQLAAKAPIAQHDPIAERERTAAIVQHFDASIAKLYKMKAGVHGFAAYRGAKTLFHEAMSVVEASSIAASEASSPDLAEQHKLRALAALRVAAHASDLRYRLLHTPRLMSGEQERRVEHSMKRLGIEQGEVEEAMEAAHHLHQAQIDEIAAIRGIQNGGGSQKNNPSNAMFIHSGYRTPMQQSFAPTSPMMK